MAIDETTIVFFDSSCLSVPLISAPLPSPADRETLAPITGEKDAHVLAAALGISARFLLTLDKRLLARITDASELSLPALSPGAFITRVLPTYPAYPSLRGE
jgi:hypothetical protein